MRKRGFPPIVRTDARLLILGTLPGEDSLKYEQYYAHKHNAFWRLVATLLGQDVPVAYNNRQTLLTHNHWALWDVLESAERVTSSDAAIKNPHPNAFAPFFANHPRLQAIAFNGQKARVLFTRYVVKQGFGPSRQLQMLDLPSSSPLHTMAFAQKLEGWHAALGPFAPEALEGKRKKR